MEKRKPCMEKTARLVEKEQEEMKDAKLYN